MKKFQISESTIDGSIFLIDEDGKIFLPSDANGVFQFLTRESANRITYFTDGKEIYSESSNGLGWITEAISAGLQIFGTVSSSQQQKKANASAERQLQLQNEQLNIQAKIQQLQQQQQQQTELERKKEVSSKTPLIVGGIFAFSLLGLAVVLIITRNKTSNLGKGKKKSKVD